MEKEKRRQKSGERKAEIEKRRKKSGESKVKVGTNKVSKKE